MGLIFCQLKFVLVKVQSCKFKFSQLKSALQFLLKASYELGDPAIRKSSTINNTKVFHPFRSNRRPQRQEDVGLEGEARLAKKRWYGRKREEMRRILTEAA